jgi:Terminase small subunit
MSALTNGGRKRLPAPVEPETGRSAREIIAGLPRRERLSRDLIRFAQAYAETLNARDSAIVAGLPADAAEYAEDLIADPLVAAEIERIVAQNLHDYGVHRRRILQEIAAPAYATVQDLIDPATGRMLPLHRLPQRVASAIASFEIEPDPIGALDGPMDAGVRLSKVRMINKLDALRLLGETMQLFGDNRPIGALAEQFQININLGEHQLVAQAGR